MLSEYCKGMIGFFSITWFVDSADRGLRIDEDGGLVTDDDGKAIDSDFGLHSMGSTPLTLERKRKGISK